MFPCFSLAILILTLLHILQQRRIQQKHNETKLKKKTTRKKKNEVASNLLMWEVEEKYCDVLKKGVESEQISNI